LEIKGEEEGEEEKEEEIRHSRPEEGPLLAKRGEVGGDR
jgi:hypothetical protein